MSGRHTSTTDLPLTKNGKKQAQEVGRYLGRYRFSLVLCSPRQRAAQTAKYAGFGEQLTIDPELSEWNYGPYEGMTTREILDAHPGWDLWRDGVPQGEAGGETPNHVAARARTIVNLVEPDVRNGSDVLLIAHAHILRAIATQWVRLPLDSGRVLTLFPGTVSSLGFEHGVRVIERWNVRPCV